MIKWLWPILFFLTGCATTQPVPPPPVNPIPVPVKQDTVVLRDTVRIHDTTIFVRHDTVTRTLIDSIPAVIIIDSLPAVHDTVIAIKTVYADTSMKPISAASFGLSVIRLDNSLPIQQAGDYIIAHPGSVSNTLIIPEGYYPCKTPIFWQNWQPARGYYFPFTLKVYGESTWRCADGVGTTLYFGGCTSCAFEMAFQGMYGGIISGITFIGRWTDPGLSGYAFYIANGLGNGVCKNTPNGPEASIVFDPFGPLPPPDGIGYTGVDAYGDSLKTFYRGQTNGSSSNEVVDIKFQHQLIDIIFSPNGYTKNDESNHIHKINAQWSRFVFVGCQPEEKGNEIGPDINIQGPCETVFQLAHGWGQGQPGQYVLHGWNSNGPVQRLLWIEDDGFFRTVAYDITAEDLGQIGMYTSNNGSTFEGKIDFADYLDETFQYLYPQIQGHGIHYRGQYRMYGTYKPITVNNLNGFDYFQDYSFDALPYYNDDYNVPGSHPVFQTGMIGGTQTDNPVGTATYIDSGQNQPYLIQDSLINRFHQATIQCHANELSRIQVGSLIIAYNPTAPFAQLGPAGLVTAIQANTFTLCFIPPQITAGQRYYLGVWTQNIMETKTLDQKISELRKRLNPYYQDERSKKIMHKIDALESEKKDLETRKIISHGKQTR
jgi:hypothetical protein